MTTDAMPYAKQELDSIRGDIASGNFMGPRKRLLDTIDDLQAQVDRWEDLAPTIAQLVNRPRESFEKHQNKPLAIAAAVSLALKYPAVHRSAYTRLHRKLVEGLVRCAEDEYLSRIGPDAFKHIPTAAPVLHAVVSMVASSVVNIVMEWERETTAGVSE